jgi:hypothetical protein
MMRLVVRAGLAVAAWLFLTQSPVAYKQDGEDTLDLASFFTGTNGLVRDTNGDRIADDVAARVIVAAAPSRDDSAAAANIAARLGFETSALSLPLVLRDNDVSEASKIQCIPITFDIWN